MTTGLLDETRSQTFLIVHQDFQEMLGREFLMTLAKGEALCRLDETAGTFGVFFKVHV